MIEEMSALHFSDTWELISLPPDKSKVGCRWVYTVKIASVYLFLSMVIVFHRPLYQLDIKNSFLHRDLEDESPPIWFGKFGMVIQEFVMVQSEVDHYVFDRHSTPGIDNEVITKLKYHLFQHFQTEDLGRLSYWNAVIRILRYIKSAPGKGLLY
ncbi:uncharacterized protein LOC132620018 [Lycium barbarum]|uniref:uncharacterized protein LOC132620018 n=1 Tax=Lycium barbarum TaxID=112863 RepID=UPI00293E1422|nr:uncharacterized protein LOC132620018 [Lycium barbarum]